MKYYDVISIFQNTKSDYQCFDMPVTFVAPISMCGVCHQEIFDMEIDSLYQERAYQLCGLVEDKVHQ